MITSVIIADIIVGIIGPVIGVRVSSSKIPMEIVINKL